MEPDRVSTWVASGPVTYVMLLYEFQVQQKVGVCMQSVIDTFQIQPFLLCRRLVRFTQVESEHICCLLFSYEVETGVFVFDPFFQEKSGLPGFHQRQDFYQVFPVNIGVIHFYAVLGHSQSTFFRGLRLGCSRVGDGFGELSQRWPTPRKR